MWPLDNKWKKHHKKKQKPDLYDGNGFSMDYSSLL